MANPKPLIKRKPPPRSSKENPPAAAASSNGITTRAKKKAGQPPSLADDEQHRNSADSPRSALGNVTNQPSQKKRKSDAGDDDPQKKRKSKATDDIQRTNQLNATADKPPPYSKKVNTAINRKKGEPNAANEDQPDAATHEPPAKRTSVPTVKKSYERTQVQEKKQRKQVREDAAARREARAPKQLEAKVKKLERRLKEVEAKKEKYKRQMVVAHGAKQRRRNRRNQAGSLIPRPLGRPHIQADLALQDDREEYDRIHGQVKELMHQLGIDFSKPWSQQPCEVTAGVVLNARALVPLLQRCVGDWATRAIGMQILRNSVGYRRRKSNPRSNFNLKRKARLLANATVASNSGTADPHAKGTQHQSTKASVDQEWLESDDGQSHGSEGKSLLEVSSDEEPDSSSEEGRSSSGEESSDSEGESSDSGEESSSGEDESSNGNEDSDTDEY